MTEQREIDAAEPPLDCLVGLDIHCYRVNYNLPDWEAIARVHGEICAPIGAVRAVNALCDEVERLQAELYVWRQMGRSLHDAGLRVVDMPPNA